ncbi:hypothetical protein VE03_09641 [Pseudogymnoascus sp. 23342-1-I1]|nr:hypothetical protein VE03_09641 [Pseudogymnoascus sp. 23342-1-I1]
MDEAAIMEAAEVAVDGFIFLWPMAFHTEDGMGDGIILDGVSGADVCITWELVVLAGRSGTGMIRFAEESVKWTEELAVYSIPSTFINRLFDKEAFANADYDAALFCLRMGMECRYVFESPGHSKGYYTQSPLISTRKRQQPTACRVSALLNEADRFF